MSVEITIQGNKKREDVIAENHPPWDCSRRPYDPHKTSVALIRWTQTPVPTNHCPNSRLFHFFKHNQRSAFIITNRLPIARRLPCIDQLIRATTIATGAVPVSSMRCRRLAPAPPLSAGSRTTSEPGGP